MEAPQYLLRRLGSPDAELLRQAERGLFEQPIDERWMAQLLRDPRHHTIGAFVGGRLVASATATHYLRPDQPPTLLVVSVAVSAGQRRKGIATALLRELLAHGRWLGCRSARSATDAGNAAAIRLHERMGWVREAETAAAFTFAF